ncbi:antitoxin VbhA family protein [Clostridium sp. Marseille-Q7071]
MSTSKNERKERLKKVRSAIAINSLDGVEPSEECKEMLEDYIKGKTEIEDNIKKLIEKYKVPENK